MTALFITILNMSVAASVVALAAMLARIPLRKAPKIFSYALWGAVLFRLVFPFSIESIFSLMPTSANSIPHNIVVSQNPAIQTGLQFIDLPVNAAINNALPPIITEYSVNPIQVVLGIAAYVWLIGFIALLLYATIGYVRLKRRIYFATLVRDNIFETDKIKSPFVLGLIRPKIYFPTTINPMQHDYILKHEQTHIKRRDYLIKPFAFITLALHWFNPIMWLSYALMSKDMEMSCDEAVLRNTNEDIRGDYSTSLLSLSVEKVSLLNPIAFGESNVKERVVNVLSFKKHSKWVIEITFVAVLAFLIGFTSNRTGFAEIPSELNNAPGSNTAVIENSIDIDTNQNRRSSVVIFAEYEEWGLTLEGLYPQSDGRFLATEIQNVFFQGQLIRGFSDFGHGVDMSISSFDLGDDMWIHVIRDANGNIERLDTE